MKDKNVEPVKIINLGKEENVLVISDLQIPAEHPDSYDFLKYVKARFKIDRAISIGDEVDLATISYHEKDPDGMSQSEEIELSRKGLGKLARIFPKLDILWSNHGSLFFRKAKSAGLSKKYIRSPQEVWGVPGTWNWYDQIILKYPNMPEILCVHNLSSNNLNNIKLRQCSVIQGHFHSKMSVECITNHKGQLMFGATVGCLIDRFKSNFDYAKNQAGVQQLGVLVLLSGQPVLVPMFVDKNNRWIRAKK